MPPPPPSPKPPKPSGPPGGSGGLEQAIRDLISELGSFSAGLGGSPSAPSAPPPPPGGSGAAPPPSSAPPVPPPPPSASGAAAPPPPPGPSGASSKGGTELVLLRDIRDLVADWSKRTINNNNTRSGPLPDTPAGRSGERRPEADRGSTAAIGANLLGASALLPASIGQGIGYAMAKSEGWRALERSLDGMSKKAGGAGAAFTAMAVGARLAGLTTAAVAAPIGAVAAIHGNASASFASQAAQHAAWNPSMAGTSMTLAVGDISRSMRLGRMTADSFGGLGSALNTFRDTILPLEAMVTNFGNKAQSFGLGFASQGIRDLMPLLPMLAGQVVQAPANVGNWFQDLGAMAQNIPGAIAANPAGLFARNKLLNNVMPQPGDGFWGSMIKVLDLSNPINGLKLWGGIAANLPDLAGQQPQFAQQMQIHAKQNAQNQGELLKLLNKIEATPADQVGAGMARVTSGWFRDLASNRSPWPNAMSNFDAGVAAQAQAAADSEDRAKEAMRNQVDRMRTLAEGELMRRPVLQAPRGGDGRGGTNIFIRQGQPAAEVRRRVNAIDGSFGPSKAIRAKRDRLGELQEQRGVNAMDPAWVNPNALIGDHLDAELKRMQGG